MRMIPLKIYYWSLEDFFDIPGDLHLEQFLNWYHDVNVGADLNFYFSEADQEHKAVLKLVNSKGSVLSVTDVSVEQLCDMLLGNARDDGWKYVLRGIDPDLSDMLRDAFLDLDPATAARYCIERYLEAGTRLWGRENWQVCGIEWGGVETFESMKSFIDGNTEYAGSAAFTVWLALQPARNGAFNSEKQFSSFESVLQWNLKGYCDPSIREIYSTQSRSLWGTNLIPLRTLVESKGAVEASPKEELWMLEERLHRDGKIRTPKNDLSSPDQSVPIIKPEEIYTEIPQDAQLGDYMELLGLYEIRTTGPDEEERIININNTGIRRFSTLLLRRRDFRAKFGKTLRLLADCSGKEVAWVLVEKLTRIVELHELGHHVFRALTEKRSQNEREALANWFASLLLDDFDTELLEYMTRLQPAVYGDPLLIPKPGKATAESWDLYAKRLTALAWREDDE